MYQVSIPRFALRVKVTIYFDIAVVYGYRQSSICGGVTGSDVTGSHGSDRGFFPY